MDPRATDLTLPLTLEQRNAIRAATPSADSAAPAPTFHFPKPPGRRGETTARLIEVFNSAWNGSTVVYVGIDPRHAMNLRNTFLDLYPAHTRILRTEANAVAVRLLTGESGKVYFTYRHGWAPRRYDFSFYDHAVWTQGRR